MILFFLLNLVLFLLNLHFLNCFFSYLSLIILINLEFYIVIFFYLHFTLWFGFMIRVTNFEGWTGFISVIFKKFIYHHWVYWKLIFFVFFMFWFLLWILFFFLILPFNTIFILYLKFDMILLEGFDKII
jgi:hypothetical protein